MATAGVSPEIDVATMRAAVLAAPHRVEIQSVPRPEIGPGQVRVRMQGCGVCGSNLPVWQGREWFEYPMDAGAPGHEGWGIVDAVGEGVDEHHVRVGDAVAMLSHNAFAEYDVTDARFVMPLPREVQGRAFPGEALACAMNVFDRSDIRSGDVVAIVGVGFLGALLVQLAVHARARVVAISRRPFALSVARRFGAEAAISFDDRAAVHDTIQKLSEGRGATRVIEVTGLQEPLDLAGELVGTRGRLVIAGYHQDGLRHVNMQQWNWKGMDVINAHERDPGVYMRGMRRAVEAMVDGRLRPDSLYTHRLPLEDINQAFEALENRPDGFMKAVVTL